MTVEVVHRENGNVVALLDRRAMVFMRDRPLTIAALDAMEGVLARPDVVLSTSVPVGVLAIVPGEAGLSRVELIARQRRLFGEARERGNVWIAFCISGGSPQTVVMRAAVRTLMLAHPRMSMHAEPERAILWLSAQTGIAADEVRGTVRALQPAA